MNLLPPFSEKDSLERNVLEASAAVKINVVVFRV
jgi:hypothetical protein